MPIRSYEEALAFWFGRINYEQTGMPPDLRALKLERMQALLDRLGRPQERLRIIHIAGSKGKGSTAAMLAAILQAAGYRTGLFTSPHLCRVEERVQVNGQCISPPELTTLMQEIESACKEVEAAGHTPPTFFEIITALGWLHFARRRVDWAVVEVGLGGRFDSTNVCRPHVAVITSISLDHVQQLGPTLAHIAREKAGIIKPGVPVVSGVTEVEPAGVIRAVARQQQAPLYELGVHFEFEYQPGQFTPRLLRWPSLRYRSLTHSPASPLAIRYSPFAAGYTIGHSPVATVEATVTRNSYRGPHGGFTPSAGDASQAGEFTLSLWGRHQAANAAVALAVVERLRELGLPLPDEAISRGLAQVHWPARVEVLHAHPTVVLDCAHNRASVAALVHTLRESFSWRRLIVVLGCSRDKDIAGMLAELAPVTDAIYLTRYSTSPRAADPEELRDLWLGPGPAHVHTKAESAWCAALEAAQPDDLICITGSVFLAGELRDRILTSLGSTVSPAASAVS